MTTAYTDKMYLRIEQRLSKVSRANNVSDERLIVRELHTFVHDQGLRRRGALNVHTLNQLNKNVLRNNESTTTSTTTTTDRDRKIYIYNTNPQTSGASKGCSAHPTSTLWLIVNKNVLRDEDSSNTVTTSTTDQNHKT